MDVNLKLPEPDPVRRLLARAQEAGGRDEQIAFLRRQYDASADDPARRATVVTALARTLAEVRAYDEALSLFSRALTEWQALGDRRQLAMTHLHMFFVLDNAGQHPDAVEHIRKVAELADSLDDADLQLRLLLARGNCHVRQQDYAAGLADYSRGLAISERSEDVVHRPSFLNNLGVVHRDAGEDALALHYLTLSLRLQQKHQKEIRAYYDFQDNPDELAAKLMVNIGQIRLRLGRRSEALEAFQQGVALSRASRDDLPIAAAVGLAMAQQASGQTTLALNTLREADALRRQLGLGPQPVLWGFANIHYNRGAFSEAIDVLKRLWADRPHDRRYSADQHYLFGRAYRAVNDSERARVWLLRAVRETELFTGGWRQTALGRAAYLSSTLGAYQELVALATDEGRTLEALTFAERAKARLLTEMTQARPQDPRRLMTAKERQRDATFEAAVSTWSARYADVMLRSRGAAALKRAADRLRRIRTEHSAFRSIVLARDAPQGVEWRPLTRRDVTTIVDEGVAVLDYVVASDAIYLFVVRQRAPAMPADVSVRRLAGTSESVGRAVREFRDRLARRDLDLTLGRELERLLVEPALPLLEDVQHLIIVPDGALWELPFEALQDEQGAFLLERYSVSYTPSLAFLLESRRRVTQTAGPGTASTLLAVGAPVGSAAAPGPMTASVPHATLADADAQVRALGALYGSERSTIFTGAAATEERFRREAGRHGILHVAAHGNSLDASPLYSHIVLERSPGSTDDGLLHAWEVLRLRLRADLVVLASCESGRGALFNGEGLVGLAWAFLAAGARTTIVAHWRVDARATRRLVEHLHGRIASGGTSAASALREAALMLARDRRYRHPFYWAAFTTIGDGQRVISPRAAHAPAAAAAARRPSADSHPRGR